MPTFLQTEYLVLDIALALMQSDNSKESCAAMTSHVKIRIASLMLLSRENGYTQLGFTCAGALNANNTTILLLEKQ